MVYCYVIQIDSSDGKSRIVRETSYENSMDKVLYFEEEYSRDSDHYSQTPSKDATVINIFGVEEDD